MCGFYLSVLDNKPRVQPIAADRAMAATQRRLLVAQTTPPPSGHPHAPRALQRKVDGGCRVGRLRTTCGRWCGQHGRPPAGPTRAPSSCKMQSPRTCSSSREWTCESVNSRSAPHSATWEPPGTRMTTPRTPTLNALHSSGVLPGPIAVLSKPGVGWGLEQSHSSSNGWNAQMDGAA